MEKARLLIKKNKNLGFWIFFFLYIIYIYKTAFNINFFIDDYFFLKISRIKSIAEFLNFYLPFRNYSYKPLAGETFYFVIHLLNNNAFLGHVIAFITYFIGLVFLYKIIKLLKESDLLAKLTVFLYGISFVHVFQIYWFATYQEIAIFAFLAISFYGFLKKKYILSILFFIFASLSKETAVLFAPFLILFVLILNKLNLKKIKNQIIPLITIVILAFLFWLAYRYSLNFVTREDNYKMAWDLRLLLNNGMWYFFWGIGFPNFMPDYFRSIFSKPLPAFWQLIKNPETSIYFYLLIIYLMLLMIGLLIIVLPKFKNAKKYLFLIIYSLINFFIFLGPILFFRHKWMIRLSLPLIFIAFAEAVIIYLLLINKNKYIKYLGLFILALYTIWNFFGVRVHENTSTYLLENTIFYNTQKYFAKHRLEILKHDYIYFKDTTNNLPKGWNGSEKLKLSLSNSNFLDHFFPDEKIKVIYQSETKKIPENAYILESNILLKQ